MYEEAITASSSLDLTGPFAGVPFLMKDLEFFAGSHYTAGSAYLKEFVAPVDSELSSRIRRAGLITLGKTNTCEFGLLPTTEPSFFGPTRNPWNLGYSAGGSSGGAAAAVAAGIVPMAHASDGGGSIRIPASCCGLFGLKISRGRNPKNPDTIGLGVSHCISRTVRDSAALLDATSGSGLGDPFVAPPPENSFVSEVNRLNEWVPFTPLANATGMPAMSVPLFWNAAKLPIGVHFMAPYGDEATLFALAGQLERARPWRDLYPPVSG
jgi:amidase